MNKNNILNFYSNKARWEEQVSEPYQQDIIKKFLIFISKKNKVNNWDVLDFGSGTGCNLITLKNFTKKIVACDINEKALSISKKENGFKNVSYVLLNGEKLPFKGKKFDLIIATEVFEHIPNYKIIFNELKRILKNNGFLIISTPNYFNLTGVIKKNNDSKNIREMWGPWGGHEGGLERFTTWWNIEKMLYGFKIIASRGADYQKSWFYNNPFFPVRFSKYILIWPGRLPFLKKLGMNYFILAQKK